MGSFKERMKVMPRITQEAGEYVVIETTVKGVVVNEVAVMITEVGFEIKDGIMRSTVALSALNINGEHPARTILEF